MGLLIDAMLGKALRWLRIFGISAEYAGSGASDDEILSLAKNKKMALATMDAPLAARAKKEGIPCVLVKRGKPEEQLAQIISGLGLQTTFPEKTRCPSCGGELAITPRSEASGLVPEKVAAVQEKFWRCLSCKKIYWEGGHWRNIGEVFAKVKSEMEKMKK